MKIVKVSKTKLGLLLARLSRFTVENPGQAKRRAAYLRQVKKLVTKKGGKHDKE